MNWQEVREHTQRLLVRLKAEANTWRTALASGETPQALSAFVRPNLGPTPEPLRRLLEPVVAAAAAAVLVVLGGIGLFHFSIFFLVAAMIYAIIHYVFGIELDLMVPA